MTETSRLNDELVAGYLAAVGRAAGGLSPSRRDELLADLAEHIAVQRAESGVDNEVGVRTILAQLGDPQAIVAEASLGDTAGRTGLDAPPVRKRRVGIGGVLLAVLLAAVLALCAGVVAFGLARGPTDQTPRPVSPPSAAVPTTTQ